MIVGMSDENQARREEIVRWLTDEGLHIEGHTDPQAHFHLICRFNRASIRIVALRNPNGIIVLEIDITLDDNYRSLLDQIESTETKDNMLWELRLGLVNLVDRMRIMDNYHEEGWIRLQNILYVENLRREQFMASVISLHSAYLSALWIVEKRAGVNRTHYQPPEPYGMYR